MPDREKPEEKDRNVPDAADARDNGKKGETDSPAAGGGKVVAFLAGGTGHPERDGEDGQDEWWLDEEGDGDDGEDGESGPRFPAWVRRLVVGVLVVALLGQLVALLPRIYNVNVMEILQETRRLSRDEQVQAYKQAIVIVEAEGNKGTGFNIDERGLIVTNHHVIGGASGAVIGFADGRVFPAEVLASDAEADLAVLVPAVPQQEAFPTLKLDAGQSWQPEDPVHYIGNPLFLRHMAGRGKVLGLVDAGKSLPVLLIEAPIYPGNSGSPVIAGNGRVIGIIYASTELVMEDGRMKAGLAIPANHPFLAETLADLAETGDG